MRPDPKTIATAEALGRLSHSPLTFSLDAELFDQNLVSEAITRHQDTVSGNSNAVTLTRTGQSALSALGSFLDDLLAAARSS